LAIASEIGAVPFVTSARARLAAVRRGAEEAPARAHRDAVVGRTIRLTKEGAVWLLTSSTGARVHVKDGRGMQYLGRLVSHPREPVHVSELTGIYARAGDGDAVLDRRARR